MIAGSKQLGCSSADYHLPDHPMSMHVKRVVEEVLTASTPHEAQVRWAIDGCNLPAPACRLDTIAGMYAGFARSRDLFASRKSPDLDAQTRHQSRIFESMARYPEMVGGSDRFCTVLMRAHRGRLIGKLGADGCYAIAIRAPEGISTDDQHRTKKGGVMGIAIKIEDGNIDILYVAVLEILRQLGIQPTGSVDDPDIAALRRFTLVDRYNTVGQVVGHTRCDLELV